MIKQSPNWLFCPVQVDSNELTTIQHDLTNFAYKTVVPIKQVGFYFIDPSVVEEHSPTCASLLKRLNLYDRWAQAGLSVTINDVHWGYNAVHIDHHDINARCFAFNIPLINCHDSYTVFYRSKTKNTGKKFVTSWVHKGEDHKNVLIFENDNDLEEIARYSANQCAFINVSVPHRPVTEHDKFRVVLTNRFTPELHDRFSEQISS